MRKVFRNSEWGRYSQEGSNLVINGKSLYVIVSPISAVNNKNIHQISYKRLILLKVRVLWLCSGTTTSNGLKPRLPDNVEDYMEGARSKGHMCLSGLGIVWADCILWSYCLYETPWNESYVLGISGKDDTRRGDILYLMAIRKILSLHHCTCMTYIWCHDMYIKNTVWI